MKGKKRQVPPWKSRELPKIGCGPSHGERSQGLLGQRQHRREAVVSQTLLPCSSAHGQMDHVPLPRAQQPRAPWCSEWQRGSGGVKSLQNSGRNFVLLLTAEQPTGHKTPHPEGRRGWCSSQDGKKHPTSMHAPNFSAQLPPSPRISCYTELEDFPHFPRSLHAVLGTCGWTLSASGHP